MAKDRWKPPLRSIDRRSVIQGVGSLIGGAVLTGTATAKADEGSVLVRQGDQTFAVEPLSGDLPVEQFYDFRLPEQYDGVGVTDSLGPYFESVGTRRLQRESATVTFLYDGPNGRSLVVVHDRPTAEGDGGAATWRVSVRPADAEWIVKDDAYWDAETDAVADSNYDDWDTDGAKHRIDWTWSAGATDGGVLGYLKDQTAIRIDPFYNDQAALYGDHYEGTVDEWTFLSGDVEDPDEFSLALDEPVAILGAKRGSVPGQPAGGPSNNGPGGGDTDDDDDRGDGEANDESADSDDRAEPGERGRGRAEDDDDEDDDDDDEEEPRGDERGDDDDDEEPNEGEAPADDEDDDENDDSEDDDDGADEVEGEDEDDEDDEEDEDDEDDEDDDENDDSEDEDDEDDEEDEDDEDDEEDEEESRGDERGGRGAERGGGKGQGKGRGNG